MQEQDVAPALFALAFVISFVGGIIGFIAPSIFRFGMPERPSRKRIAGIALGICFASLVGLGVTVPETPEHESRAEPAALASSNAQSPEAAVISTTEGDNIPRVKRSVVVRLSREISYSDLVALGSSIRDQDSNYERVFVEYYLPGMREGAGAWAVTHWNPNQEVRIFGNVQRFDHMTEAEARTAMANELLNKPGVAELLKDPDFLAREEAGWAAVSCEGVKGTDELYRAFRMTTGEKREVWSAASHVVGDRYQSAEDGGQKFDCGVVEKYVAKGWLAKDGK